jgi:hypothetical protein
MTRGRQTCNTLKEIRQQIADKNDIEFTTSECDFEGECQGTCPKCEEELQYLENELNKRKQQGKEATISGVSSGIAETFATLPTTTNYEPEKATETIITVGQHLDCDVIITDDKLGKKRPHCLLIRDNDGNFFVQDCKTLNGTFVNGQRINGIVALQLGDHVRIGNTVLPWTKYFLEDLPPPRVLAGDIQPLGGKMIPRGYIEPFKRPAPISKITSCFLWLIAIAVILTVIYFIIK